MTKPITVLIVDDSALIRQMFSEILAAEPDIHVLDTASDPYDARDKIKLLNPDVLTLDIEMPKMDGLSFLEKIMALRPMPVIMCSSLTQKGASETLRALELGAFDYIGKPVTNQTHSTIGQLKEQLVTKIRAAAKANMARRNSQKTDAPIAVIPYQPKSAKTRCVVAIGASTGGVEALKELFQYFPKNMPPIVVTQHMPETFTRSFAERLNTVSQMQVSEAENHTRLREGQAYVAPGGNTHLKIVKIGGDWVCKLEEGATVSSHRPSVDVLFRSVADVAGKYAVGAILTGMGKDGADGLLAMRMAGAHTFGQNEASCIVYGMPKVANAMGAVEQELSLSHIPKAIIQTCERL